MTRLLLLLLVAVLSVATACSALAVAAATVNGEKITEAEVETELDTLRDDPVFGETLRRDPDTRGQRRREILQQLIYQRVAEQEARKLKIRVSRDQIERLISQEAASRGTTVGEFLEQQNLSRGDARRIAGRAVRRFELMERVITDVDVDEDAVREVYEAQRERFVEVHLERIIVRDEGTARDVLEELGEGASFGDVAADRSTDQLAARGGDMGYVPLTSLDVEVQGALGRAVEGGLTDPIRGRGEATFEIYRLVDRRTKPFEEVAADLRSDLTREQRDQRFGEWLAGRVRNAKVVVNPKYGRFDRRQQQPGVVPSTGELTP